MLGKLLGLSDGVWDTFVTISVSGLFYYFLLTAFFYGWIFILRRRKYHPDYKPDRAENLRSVKWSIFSVLGNALLMLPLHYFIAQGDSQIYYEFDAYPLWYFPVSIVIFLAFTETCVYFVHWGLHKSNWLYENVHKPHHSFQVTTSFTGLAFNPLDSFAQALPHHLIVFLIPVHYSVYIAFVAFVTVWAVMIHDRVSFVKWRGINYTGHHTLHHWYYDYNFGQFFTVWDRIMGTYKNPEVAYSDIPEGIVRRVDGFKVHGPLESEAQPLDRIPEPAE